MLFSATPLVFVFLIKCLLVPLPLRLPATNLEINLSVQHEMTVSARRGRAQPIVTATVPQRAYCRLQYSKKGQIL